MSEKLSQVIPCNGNQALKTQIKLKKIGDYISKYNLY